MFDYIDEIINAFDKEGRTEGRWYNVKCCSWQSLQGRRRLREAPAWKGCRVSQPGGQDIICHQMSQTWYLHCYCILNDESASTRQGWLEQIDSPNEISQRHVHAAADP
jgi:hypothetical protein